MMVVDNRSVRCAFLVVVCSCTVPPPFYGLESPATLPAGRVSLTAAGGGACDSVGCSLVGGASRFRLGIGARQEVGVDGEALPAWGSTYGFKFAYKLSPRDGLAFTAGLGATYQDVPGRFAALGGDLGAIISLGHLSPDTPVFGAVRVSVAVPTWSNDIYKDGGIVEMATIPIGLSHPVAPGWELIGEVAAMVGLATSRTIGHRIGVDESIRTGALYGLYGALAIVWTP
jgi:hypothetical protein